jgi:hypothetical protein
LGKTSTETLFLKIDLFCKLKKIENKFTKNKSLKIDRILSNSTSRLSPIFLQKNGIYPEFELEKQEEISKHHP